MGACSMATGESPPPDAGRDAPFPWTRFLAEAFPEGLDPLRARRPHTIREPGPDTANYPNSPETLPRGAASLETSPVFWTSAIGGVQPSIQPARTQSTPSPATASTRAGSRLAASTRTAPERLAGTTRIAATSPPAGATTSSPAGPST